MFLYTPFISGIALLNITINFYLILIAKVNIRQSANNDEFGTSIGGYFEMHLITYVWSKLNI